MRWRGQMWRSRKRLGLFGGVVALVLFAYLGSVAYRYPWAAAGVVAGVVVLGAAWRRVRSPKW